MNRRGFLIGLGASVAAPAIVHASNLMSISVLPPIANKTDMELWNEAMQWATQRPKRTVAENRLLMLAKRYEPPPPTPEEIARIAHDNDWKEIEQAARDIASGKRKLYPDIDYGAIGAFPA